MSNNYKKQIDEEFSKGKDLSVVNLVNSLIGHGHSLRASDIHMDAKSKALNVRFRIDGVMKDIMSIPKEIESEVISRIKILSHLRTDEHQMTQDGRFRIAFDNPGVIDVRVAVSPAYYGESIILRLLADKESEFNLSNLGFSQENQDKLLAAINKPYGMILATGPTGSGKTTTLYTVLKILNTSDVSIITIEDPIEYAIDNIRQIPVNHRTGLTFNAGLKSILRQDPDIIMVGEIRDEDTAGLAINSALTGHLLLSTLHTNDAATTLPRLLDMKVEPYLISSTVNVAIGQRLVRKICESCKEEKPLSGSEIKSITTGGIKIPGGKKLFRGAGCDKCNQTGYKGRIGIYEVMPIESNIRQAILKRESSEVIKKLAIKNGMTTIAEDGLAKVFAGVTTLEEILRVIHE